MILDLPVTEGLIDLVSAASKNLPFSGPTNSKTLPLH